MDAQNFSLSFWMPTKFKSTKCNNIQQVNSQLGKRKEIFKCQIIWNLQWLHFINRSIMKNMKTCSPPTRAEMGRNSNTSFTPEIFQRLIQHSCNGLQLPVLDYINNWDRCVPTYHLHLGQTSSQAISGVYHTHQRQHGWHQWHDRCPPRTIRMKTIIHVHQTILSTNPGLRQWNHWRGKKSVQLGELPGLMISPD